MIYTVTFNPALDYSVTVENFKLGATNRTNIEQILPGGKGINVSVVLNNLGIENTALGFIAGFSGDEINRKMQETGCTCDFIKIHKGISRINMKLKSDEETEINGQGPVIDDIQILELFKKLEILSDKDVLVLAGSVPTTINDTIYGDIMARLRDKGVMVVVDATKNLLINSLEYHPFLIKPNHFELGEIFNVVLNDNIKEIILYAKMLQNMGARNILVSMAGNGAILLLEDGTILKCVAPLGKVINSVGAGDSMVAGFLAGWIQENDYAHAFKMGVSAGSASAFSELLATKETVEKIYLGLEITRE